MLHALPLFSIDCSPHFLDILQLAGHFIPMNLNETEQQVLSDMYQLYCADAKAAQERKDEANRAYYTEMRRNGLKLAGLSSDLINVQLTPKDMQRVIQLTLPMLYIAVGNQKFGLSKVTCCAEQLVGKRLHESYDLNCLQIHYDVQYTHDDDDEMSRTPVHMHFIRQRGFSYLEMITTDVKHSMFTEDAWLRRHRDYVLTYISHRANPIARQAFPELDVYTRNKTLSLNMGSIFKNWVCLKRSWVYAGDAPLGESCTWQEWIKTARVQSASNRRVHVHTIALHG